MDGKTQFFLSEIRWLWRDRISCLINGIFHHLCIY